MFKDRKSTVLITGNEPDIIDIVHQALQPHFLQMYTSKPLIEKLLKLKGLSIERLVIIFVFDTPDIALDFYEEIEDQGLFSNDMDIEIARLLMTDRHHKERAYELCVEGVFDFYASTNPIYDIDQIKLIMLNLSRKLQRESESSVTLLESQKKASQHQIEKLENSVKNMKNTLQEKENVTKEQYKKRLGSVNKIYDQMQQDIEKNGLPADADAYFKDRKDQNLEHTINVAQQYSREILKQLKLDTYAFEGGLVELKLKLFKRKDNTKTVMIVDDQQMVRNVLTSVLEKTGYFVITAQDGVQAMLEAELAKPDIILLDIGMPKMDGRSFLKARMSNPLLADIPIVMLTGMADKDTFSECKQLGAVDYIVKPANARTVLEKISQHISVSK